MSGTSASLIIEPVHCRLWEGRYKSTLVDSEQYFLLVSRYIELNPVRANMGLMGDPADL
jgi:putative transposase